MTQKIMALGLIRLGLKRTATQPDQTLTIKSHLKSHLKRLVNEMDHSLLTNNFFRACLFLMKVIKLDIRLEYSSMSRIWQFALKKRDVSYIEVVLQIMQKPVGYQLLEDLYESLFFMEDMTLQLPIADLLYSRVQVVSDDFLSLPLVDYYVNKKNLFSVDLIETIHQALSQ